MITKDLVPRVGIKPFMIMGIGMDGRDLQPWVQGVALGLDASMLPFCAVAPVLLLWSGYTCLRRAASAGRPWTLAWCAAASASLACEALFLIRVVHMLATPYFNLGYMAWHAFDFSVAFMVIGAVMICMLIAVRRSSAKTHAANASVRK